MKSQNSIVLSLLFLSSLQFSLAFPQHGLMLEFIRDPRFTQINDPQPEFSWIVNRAAEYQTAFQILVATSKRVLEKNQADVWDSGKTKSNQSTNVEYAGNPLQENTTYYWKVRIWGKDDQPSAYSAIQQFHTGKLENYQTTQNYFQIDRIKPKQFKKLGANHYFADFGQAAFGTLILNITPTESETLLVHLGEKKLTSGQIDRKPGGSIRYQKVTLHVSPEQSEYILQLPPDQRNTGPAAVALPDSFGVITPFRYCEIENCSFELRPDQLCQQAYHYYFEDDQSEFTSSDTILNQIWDLCKYSIKATSFCGLYVDGDRERIPYEADAFINQLGHYGTDREYSLARLTNEYFITHPTWPTEWILHTVLLFYYDWMYTGNDESIAHYYETLKLKTLLDLAREDGLISSKSEKLTGDLMRKLGFTDENARLRDIVDWPPAQKDTGWKLATPEGERDGYEFRDINTVVNALHYQNLKLMAQIAQHLGKTKDSQFFRKRAAQVKSAINKKLFDSAKGIYVDGEGSKHASLHANMFPLAFEMVPEEHLPTVIEFIKSRGMACSVYGAQYLLEGLYLAGEADYALQLMTATHDRSWWNMIKSGSTITMGAWDMKYKPNADWNHAWGAVPANMIPRGLWGIRPLEPGFGKVQIKPQLASLTGCKIKTPTIKGPISGEYTVTANNRQKYRIELPGNVEADLVLPAPPEAQIIVDNSMVQQGKSPVIHLKSGIHVIEIIPN